MTIDPTDALADARDGLDRAAGPFLRAQARMGVASGRDSTGEVLVRVKPDGSLDDAMIGSQWHRGIAPDALGAAVMEAYADASTQMLTDWGESVAEETERPELRPMPDISTSLHARLNELTDPSSVAEHSEAALNRLADFLAEMNDEIDQVTAEAESVATAVSVGEVRGIVTSVNGLGNLVDVRIDADRASTTSSHGIGQDLMKAYRSALREARSRTVDDVIAGSRVGELQRLADDPRGLIERFGLA